MPARASMIHVRVDLKAQATEALLDVHPAGDPEACDRGSGVRCGRHWTTSAISSRMIEWGTLCDGNSVSELLVML